MHKRLPYLVFFLASLCIVPVALSQVKAAVVQTWHYNPQTKMVTVVIANTSGKDITAYSTSIGGNERMVDMLATVMVVQRAKGTSDEDHIRREYGNGTLAAYQTREQMFGPFSNVVTDFPLTIVAVAYADGTGEATDAAALGRIREHRNQELHSYQKAKDVINEVLADSTIQKPAEEAAARLQQFLNNWKAQIHYSLDIEEGIIRAVIRDLNFASRIIADRGRQGRPLSESEYLHEVLEEKDQYISLLSKHVQLKEAAQ